MQALGVSVGGEVLAGMRITLTHRSTARSEDEPSEADAHKKPELMIAGCRTSQLPLYFVGAEAESVALYEQLFAHCRGIYFRHLDHFGDPVVFQAPPDVCSRSDSIGTTRYLPSIIGCSRGSTCCANIFAFPRKFLGCRLTASMSFCLVSGANLRHRVCL